MNLSPQCHVNKCTLPALYSDKLQRHIRECQLHQTKRLARDAKRRQQKHSTQTCMACSSPRDGESVYCKTHRVSHSTRMKLRRQQNKQEGVCVECRAVVSTQGHSRCTAHIEQQRDYTLRIDNLSPQRRRHYAKYCSICGVFRVHDASVSCVCTVCDGSRTQCIEYRWHEEIEGLARNDSLWPPSSSTFFNKRAFGTYECRNERLVYSDMVFLLPDRLVVMECDEFAHESNTPECELSRMDSLQFGTNALLPTIVLRFNPHQPDRRLVYSDFSSKVRQYWDHVRHYITCPTTALPPLQQVQVVYFFYPPSSQHILHANTSERFMVTCV